ncbi:MAG: glycosyltransferase family 2 protein [Gammaproteobacteria bacterium]|nr:glycosyltransferase family 2 protein [Gammaproteobacteria bacterium]
MQHATTAQLISLVVPIYNEEAVLPSLFAKLYEKLASLPLPFEVILVDDGSTDNSWALLRSEAGKHSNIKLLRFSRNFGKEAAILAGLKECDGDAVVVIDADLQHPPGMLVEMVDIWLQGDVDIIHAVKSEDRNAPLLDRVTSYGFGRLFRRITGYEIRGATDYKLLDRRVVDILREMRDYSLFFRGTTLWLGFRHRELYFELGDRRGGKSKWTSLSRLRLGISALTSFTALPLHLMTVLGAGSLLFALAMGAHTFYNKINGEAVEGFTSVILLILIFGSLTILCLGVIGAYLAKIHDEVRGRPRYLIDEKILPPGADESR